MKTVKQELRSQHNWMKKNQSKKNAKAIYAEKRKDARTIKENKKHDFHIQTHTHTFKTKIANSK